MQQCSKDYHDSVPGFLFNRQNNPKTDLILCSGLAWTCVETIGVAGTFFLKQTWRSIIPVMKEKKKKTQFIFRIFFMSCSFPTNSLYLFISCQWLHTGTHDNTLFKTDKIRYSNFKGEYRVIQNWSLQTIWFSFFILLVRKPRPGKVMQRINDNTVI